MPKGKWNKKNTKYLVAAVLAAAAKKGRSKQSTKAQLSSMKKQIKRIKKDIEYKYYDHKQDSMNVTASASVQAIGLQSIHELQDESMAAGQSTPGPERDGNKITLSRISIRGRLTVAAATAQTNAGIQAADQTNNIRLLLVKYDRTPISWSGPAISHVLTEYTQPQAFYSHYKKEGLYKIKVLKDLRFKLQYNGKNNDTSAVHPQEIFFTINKKFKKGLIGRAHV